MNGELFEEAPERITPRTPAEAGAYLDLDHPHPCTYGHFHCAAWVGGPCCDELAGEFKLDYLEDTP